MGTTREPADAVQAHALANHWRADDPHPQYLLRSDPAATPSVIPQASNVAPANLNTAGGPAAAGVSQAYARADHVHHIDTSVADAALTVRLNDLEARVNAAAVFVSRQYAWSVAS